MRSVANWGGTIRFRPARQERPGSLDELVSLVTRARTQGDKVRPLGAGQAWSPLSTTERCLVDLSRLDRCQLTRPGIVRVGAGVRIRQLNQFLGDRGQALLNLEQVPSHSVVGATLTGCHGSGPQALLAAQVDGLTLVKADGSLVELTVREPDGLFAAGLSLGLLGLVTSLDLRCVPRFEVQEERQLLSFDEAFGPAMLDRLQADSYPHYVWVPQAPKVLFIRRWASAAPASPDLPVAGGQRWSARWWSGRTLRGSLSQPGHRVGRSDQMLCEPVGARYNETEYGLPIQRAGEAMHRFRRIVEQERLPIDRPVIVRFAQADRFWLSPAFARATAHVSFKATPGRAFQWSRAALEPVLKMLGGRPHWATCFEADPMELARAYPETYDRFRDLSQRWDPDRLFQNDFTERLFPAP